jgi:hypothetical protein
MKSFTQSAQRNDCRISKSLLEELTDDGDDITFSFVDRFYVPYDVEDKLEPGSTSRILVTLMM